MLALLFVASCETKQSSETPRGKIFFTSNRDGDYNIYMYDFERDSSIQISKHSKTDFAPHSVNGEQVYYYSDRQGPKNIFIHDRLKNTERELFPDTADNVLPCISADGKFLVYCTNRWHGNRDLELLDLQSKQTRVLTNNEFYEESPSLHPNGKTLLFTRMFREEGDSSHAANGEIFSLNLLSKEETQLTNKKGYDSGAQFSPDGKWIAFYGESEKNWDVYLLNVAENSIENLTADSLECYSPSWSPDGKFICYTAGSKNDFDLWIINVQSKEKRKLVESSGREVNPCWTK